MTSAAYDTRQMAASNSLPPHQDRGLSAAVALANELEKITMRPSTIDLMRWVRTNWHTVHRLAHIIHDTDPKREPENDQPYQGLGGPYDSYNVRSV